MLSPTQALVIWFTYQPDGQQAYLLGVGDIVGDRINFAQLGRSHGPRFGTAFNPADLINEDWGSLVMTFDSCSNGYGSYIPSAKAAQQGWPTEQLNVVA